MPLEVKLWKIEADKLKPIDQGRLDLEERLEEWLRGDIGLLSADLLVIGSQIARYGVPLDLLAVDRDGNLVVVELKRDRTPRDVVAQALDYASWVQELGREDVEEYAREYLKEEFDDAFRKRFRTEPPEVVNERHRIYIVASSLDDTTQRIVKYLSSTYRVGINAATFAYFKTPDGEFVARSMLLDEEDVEERAKARPGAKRQPARSEDELRAIAEECGAADLWDVAMRGFGSVARKQRSRTTLWFQVRLEEGYSAIISVFPEASSREKGLAVAVVTETIVRHFGVAEDRIKAICGDRTEEYFGTWHSPDDCFHLDEQQLKALVALITGQ